LNFPMWKNLHPLTFIDAVDVSTVRSWVVHFSSTLIGQESPPLVQIIMSMQALFHGWQKCIANGGDFVKKECFVTENLLY